MADEQVNLTPEKIRIYRKTGEQRLVQHSEEIAHRRELAWDGARQAAVHLKEKFRATRVVVFGSLVHPGCFTRWSDVDVAAWGIAPQDTFLAIGAVEDLDLPVDVNLVDINACRPSLIEIINQEGVEL